jgi:chromosome segregation ATPase
MKDESRESLLLRIQRLEMKVSILKKTCIDALERHSEGGITADYQELLRRLEVSQARADALNQEMISLREHRDEVVRQIKHQHSHVLFLTEKIERMQAKGLGALIPRKFRTVAG